METSQTRRKNQWAIQGSTDTCKWYLDNRIKIRRLRETQHKKGYTVQRAQSDIIIDVLLETKGSHNISESHNHTCALETKGGPNISETHNPRCAILRLKAVHWSC